jgi:hypothetical protein
MEGLDIHYDDSSEIEVFTPHELTALSPCIEFVPAEHERHGFRVGQLLHYCLEPNAEDVRKDRRKNSRSPLRRRMWCSWAGDSTGWPTSPCGRCPTATLTSI